MQHVACIWCWIEQTGWANALKMTLLLSSLSPVRDHFSLQLGPCYYGSMLKRKKDTLKRAKGEFNCLLKAIQHSCLSHTPGASVCCCGARRQGSRPPVWRRAVPGSRLQSNGPPPPPGSPAAGWGCAPAGPPPSGPPVTPPPLRCCSVAQPDGWQQ